jgi:hypothetical protein
MNNELEWIWKSVIEALARCLSAETVQDHLRTADVRAEISTDNVPRKQVPSVTATPACSAVTCCLHFQGRNVKKTTLRWYVPDYKTLHHKTL